MKSFSLLVLATAGSLALTSASSSSSSWTSVSSSASVNDFAFVREAELPSTSDSRALQCFANIEAAKKISRDAFLTPTVYQCEDVKNLCKACSQCKTFTAAATGGMEKQCVCSAGNVGGVTLSGKNDCFISVDPTSRFSVDAGDGDDCIIASVDATSVGNNNNYIYGSLGDDDILLLNDGIYSNLNIETVSAGDGEDCVFVGAGLYEGPIFGVYGAFVYGGDGDDVIVLDRLKDDNGGYGTYPDEQYLLVDGDDGDDIIIASAQYDSAVIYGGDGDDVIRVVNAEIEYGVYGGDGDDDIRLVGPNNYVEDIYGGAGNDRIQVNGALDTIHGGSGDDHILVDREAWVHEIYGNDGVDKIVVHGMVRGELRGGDGRDTIEIATEAFAYYINGDDDNDDIQVNGRLFRGLRGGNGDDSLKIGSKAIIDYVYGGEGDDHVQVSGVILYGVDGGLGDDEISISSNGRLRYVDGSDGDDVIDVSSDAEIVQGVYGGDGYDVCTDAVKGTLNGYVSCEVTK